MTGPARRLAPDDGDQVVRLARFRAAHPDVDVAAGEFGTWQARSARASPGAEGRPLLDSRGPLRRRARASPPRREALTLTGLLLSGRGAKVAA